ncbi:MAG: NAD(P)/FAD-dependent oxidoreductase [Betaproteobacteria bacterium]|nr:NAD(P)/FAD-dependent oxidoreductase [Betaproteobacteria bacterium]
MATDFDCLVIGAGVVGLAIARGCAQQGLDTLVIESAPRTGTGTSSRNSGVIHAGLYYPDGSRKAAWCVRGRALLYEYCEAHQVPHRRLGKLIVGQAEDEPALQTIDDRARKAGVTDLQWLTRTALATRAPELHAAHALWSPSTGIVDAHALMSAFEGDLHDAGGAVALSSRFVGAQQQPDDTWKVTVAVGSGRAHGEAPGADITGKSSSDSPEDSATDWLADSNMTVTARRLINAAGLDADAVAARIEGHSSVSVPQMYFAKGSYARYSGRSPFSSLVYPAPVPGGLGTHLTLDMGGQAQFGPDVEWLGPADAGREPGTTHAVMPYAVDPERLTQFARDVQRWWPSLSPDALQPGYSGVRPKLSAPGAPAADFLVRGPEDERCPGLVQLFGIESPGLTASLAIAEHVVTLVRD